MGARGARAARGRAAQGRDRRRPGAAQPSPGGQAAARRRKRSSESASAPEVAGEAGELERRLDELARDRARRPQDDRHGHRPRVDGPDARRRAAARADVRGRGSHRRLRASLRRAPRGATTPSARRSRSGSTPTTRTRSARAADGLRARSGRAAARAAGLARGPRLRRCATASTRTTAGPEGGESMIDTSCRAPRHLARRGPGARAVRARGGPHGADVAAVELARQRQPLVQGARPPPVRADARRRRPGLRRPEGPVGDLDRLGRRVRASTSPRGSARRACAARSASARAASTARWSGIGHPLTGKLRPEDEPYVEQTIEREAERERELAAQYAPPPVDPALAAESAELKRRMDELTRIHSSGVKTRRDRRRPRRHRPHLRQRPGDPA